MPPRNRCRARGRTATPATALPSCSIRADKRHAAIHQHKLLSSLFINAPLRLLAALRPETPCHEPLKCAPKHVPQNAVKHKQKQVFPPPRNAEAQWLRPRISARHFPKGRQQSHNVLRRAWFSAHLGPVAQRGIFGPPEKACGDKRMAGFWG